MGSGVLAELAYKAIRRGGKAVIVGVARATEATAFKPMTMVFEEKTLQGSYFGSSVPRVDFPRMLALQTLDNIAKCLHILESLVHGGKADIGHLVEIGQRLHHQFAG